MPSPQLTVAVCVSRIAGVDEQAQRRSTADAREIEHRAFVDGLIDRDDQHRRDVADRDVELRRVGAAVVVGDGDGDGVDAVVGVGVRRHRVRRCRGAAKIVADSTPEPSPQSTVAVCVSRMPGSTNSAERRRRRSPRGRAVAPSLTDLIGGDHQHGATLLTVTLNVSVSLPPSSSVTVTVTV